MNQKNNFFVWLSLLYLLGPAGCTANDVIEEKPAPGSDYVELSVQPPDVSRSVDTRVANENLPVGATVRVVAYQRPVASLGVAVDYSTAVPTAEATYVVNADGTLTPCVVDGAGKKTAGTPLPFFVYRGTYDFYAISPARPLTKSATYQVSLVSGEDVMTSYLQGMAVKVDNATVVLNTFKRQCSRIIFKVVPATTNTIELVKLTAKSIALTAMPALTASIAVGNETKVIIPTAATPQTFSNFVAVLAAEDPKKLGLMQATNILLPKSNAAFTVRVTLDYGEKGKAVVERVLQASMPVSVFGAGNSYVVTLTVDNNSSTLTYTIVPWGSPVTDTDDNMGGPIK